MRLWIIMVGQLRTAEPCFRALERNFVGFSDCRICVQCPSDAASEAKRLYQTQYVDAWNPGPSPLGIKTAWPLLGNSGAAVRKAKPSFYYQLTRQARAADVFAQAINWESDWILKWRPDLRLLGQFAWRQCLTEQAIWLPFHDNHGGLNDQCALGPATLMRKYLHRISMLPEYFSQGGAVHAETFLEWSMMRLAKRRMAIPYCIDRGYSLNPVKISAELGDVVDAELIRTMQGEGAQVELNSADRRPQALGLAGRTWQGLLARPLLRFR